MNAKRTDIDFSKHELIIRECKECNTTIHELKIPGSSVYRVKFVNTEDLMYVTGDLYNWMFCRCFVPTANNYVSDCYWIEKLRLSSSQDPYEFDSDEVKRECAAMRKDHKLSADEKEWLDEVEDAAANDGEYYFIAKLTEYPRDFDLEYMPNGKVVNGSLRGVFDAFDEICKRLKKMEQEKCKPS